MGLLPSLLSMMSCGCNIGCKRGRDDGDDDDDDDHGDGDDHDHDAGGS